MENLLIPRFEIIADYPLCPYRVGRVLTPVTKKNQFFECIEAPASLLIQSPENYPHLFRKMDWWELRTEQEMPKYLMSLIDEEVYEVLKWHRNNTFGQTEPDRMSGCDLTCFKSEYGYVPITEEQYLKLKS